MYDYFAPSYLLGLMIGIVAQIDAIAFDGATGVGSDRVSVAFYV